MEFFRSFIIIDGNLAQFHVHDFTSITFENRQRKSYFHFKVNYLFHKNITKSLNGNLDLDFLRKSQHFYSFFHFKSFRKTVPSVKIILFPQKFPSCKDSLKSPPYAKYSISSLIFVRRAGGL